MGIKSKMFDLMIILGGKGGGLGGEMFKLLRLKLMDKEKKKF